MNGAKTNQTASSSMNTETESRFRSTLSENVIRSEFEAILSEESDNEDESSGNNVLEQQNTTNSHLGSNASVEDEIILSMIWNRNQLGAAYYDIATSELFVLNDIHDDSANFNVTKALYRQCRPHYLVTIAAVGSAFSNILKKLVIKKCLNEEVGPGSSSQSTSDKEFHVVLKMMSKKENEYERCNHRVRCLKLVSEPRNASVADRFTFLNTILSFKCHAMIHALGLLLLFLDKHWNNIALDPSGKAAFVSLNHIMLRDLVMVDDDTYEALQIVQPRHHPSLFKFGKTSTKTEGFSLFSLLNRCQSRPGTRFLWKALQYPTRDLAVINLRLDAIEFFMDLNNAGTVENLLSYLKYVQYPTSTVFGCELGPQAKTSYWYRLYKTVSHLIYIADICESHGGKNELFKKIADSITREMQCIKYFIEFILDFEASRREHNFIVKPNVDPLLDELTHAKNKLPNLLTQMAERDMRNHLPQTVTGCQMVYLPNIGYVLAINAWNPTPPENMVFPALEFKFTINNVHYYKSPSARELDETIGDITLKIANRQTQIMLKLLRYVNKNFGAILKAIHLCGELDTLLAFYTIARDYNYVRPKVVESQIIAVKEGRHPLQECLTTFVPNDINSGGEHSLVKVLTGPNSSGKSIYLKQVGLLVFMAHIGCYLPAKSATIGVVTHIFTQMLITDTIDLNASSFLQDLRQINVALGGSTPNCLILMDEFGKGTTEVSGISLLAAVLDSLAERDNNCPHVFATTHMQLVLTFLPQTPLIEAQTFEYIANDDESLSFLYRLTAGNANCSFAHSTAREFELDENVVKRGIQVCEKIKQRSLPSRQPVSQHSLDMAIHLVQRSKASDMDFDLNQLKKDVLQIMFPNRK